MKKETLQLYTVHDLRVIARSMGIPHPSMLNKKQLVEKIIFPPDKSCLPCSNRGRKAHAGLYLISQPTPTIIDENTIKEVELILCKAKDEILQLLKSKIT